ncbi:MAG: VCBS domain-containing protein [Marinomonas foliarum]|uniref:VCBS domain-containing protein n=1 Tax=Marinomonas foliarum TaxID=491950 RepID=UPI003F9DBD26
MTVLVDDGNGGTDTQTITITVTGTNDAAVISGDTTANLLEDDETSLSDGVISTGGKLTISDVDSEDNPTFDPSRVESSEGAIGSLTIAADGTWSYKVDNDKLQTLAQGDELVERFTVYATDGSSEEIVVRVGGVDDVSVISDDTVNTLSISEDETLTIPLPLEISDIDNGENPSFPAGSINGSFGVFVIADISTTGSSTWEYQLDTSKVQYLNDGESVQEKITVTASDGTNYELVVNINGSNDVPTVEGAISKAVVEGGDLLTGSVDASDVDSDVLSFSVIGSVPAGFTLNTDGAWSFDPKNEAYDSLALGVKQDITVDILVSDEDGGSAKQTITISVIGTNDDPVATADIVSTSSSNVVTIDALANDNDVDGDSLSITGASVTVPSNGSVSIVDNKLVFTPAEGFSGPATINYSISDGKGGTDTSTVTVNVNLVLIDSITSDDVINATEAAADMISISGKALGGDIAEGDVVTMTINGTEYDTTVDANGNWTVNVAGADLAADTEFEVVVKSSDAAGNTVESKATSTHSVDLEADAGTVAINPITSDDKIDGVELGQTVTVSGTATGGDISVGDVVKMTINNKEYSTTVATGGVWVLAVAGSDLAADTEFQVVVTSRDDAGNTVESVGVSTHVVDLSAEVTLSADEGQSVVLTDLPEGFRFPDGVTQVTTDFGATISLKENGDYEYEAPVRDHGDNVSDQDSVTVTLDDGRTFTIKVDVEDSAPVAINDEDSIIVQRETFEVTDIEANWVSYQNGSDVKTFDGTSQLGGLDNDLGKDQIRWGSSADSSNLQSGYGFIDNDAGLNGQFDLNEDIVIGTFTHYNYPVYEGGAISEASMVVGFSVTDNKGVTEPVSLTVNFDHNETPNTNDAEASKDIVTVRNTFVTFEWEGEVYTLQVVGFKDASDPDSPVVTSIHTAENAATSYELVVRVVEGAGYSLPETTGNVLDDNGLGADELSEDGSVTVVGVAPGDTVTLTDTNVGQSIHGQYGDLVLNDDGSYVYKVTAGVSSIPSGATETFSYMIQDSDGSSSSASLTISVGTNTAPQAQDDGSSGALFAGLVGEYYGTDSQINNISDFKALIDSKEPDATFKASNVNYGPGSGDVAKGSNLQTFLGSDSSTLSADPGDNTDGGIYLKGYVYLAAGTYNFKVIADDGYQINIDGEAVATIDNNQTSNTTTHQAFTIGESGYHAIDMVWWDQGGDYVFQPTLSSDGGATYFVIDSSMLSSTGEAGLTTSEEQGLVISTDSLLANDTDADGDTLTVTSVSNAQNGYAYINSNGDIVFTPKAGFIGSASFDYTITDGQGGYDTATATIVVNAASDAANVMVTITEVKSNWEGFGSKSDVIDSATYHDYNYDQWQQFGSGNDQIVIDNDVEKWLDAGDGNNSIYVGDDVNRGGGAGIKTGSGNDDIFVEDNVHSTIQTGEGNDRVQIGNDLGNDSEGAHINLGDGDNKLIIEDDVNKHSTVHSGSGDDFVSIGDDVRYQADIQLGSGDDTLKIGGNIDAKVSINLGSGNDLLVVGGEVSSSAWVDGGQGSDSVWFESYSRSDYNSDKDGIRSRFVNFENIKFSDGSVIGDSSAFDSTNNDSAPYFKVQVSVENLSDSEVISTVDIFGVPEGAKLLQSGQDLQVNQDGSYTVQVANGATAIDGLTVVSKSESDIEEFELTASINTDGQHDKLVGTSDEDVIVGGINDDYLEGASDEDTLLGGSGDDVLFGGDDEASDILTGGAGNDIFILNDVTNSSNIDTITDFNVAEDALDLTDLLVGIEGSPDKDADVDAVTAFLSEHVKVTDGSVKVDSEDVANFGEESNFSSSDSIKVIYNNEEYSINIDG